MMLRGLKRRLQELFEVRPALGDLQVRLVRLESTLANVERRLTDAQEEQTRLHELAGGSQRHSARSGTIHSWSAADDFQSAADLDALFGELVSHRQRWQQCELLIGCPLTSAGLRRLFPATEILVVEEGSSLGTCLANSGQTRKRDWIGIVSPWIMSFLYAQQAAMIPLVQCARQGLLCLLGNQLDGDAIGLRRFLHRVGYYEVGVPADAESIDFSTVGVCPDGSFDLRASQPGLLKSDAQWSTLIASRVAMTIGDELPWRAVSGCPRFAWATGSVAAREEYALLTRSAAAAQSDALPCTLSATARWKEAGGSTAGLVACYHGPGDSHMYAAIVQPLGPSESNLSLWINTGQWDRLTETTIAEPKIKRDAGESRLPFWLKVTHDALLAGSENDTLLSISDERLSRRAVAGVRLIGDAVSLDNVSIDFPCAEPL